MSKIKDYIIQEQNDEIERQKKEELERELRHDIYDICQDNTDED
jgi:hypothetical protein